MYLPKNTNHKNVRWNRIALSNTLFRLKVATGLSTHKNIKCSYENALHDPLNPFFTKAKLRKTFLLIKSHSNLSIAFFLSNFIAIYPFFEQFLEKVERISRAIKYYHGYLYLEQKHFVIVKQSQAVLSEVY